MGVSLFQQFLESRYLLYTKASTEQKLAKQPTVRTEMIQTFYTDRWSESCVEAIPAIGEKLSVDQSLCLSALRVQCTVNNSAHPITWCLSLEVGITFYWKRWANICGKFFTFTLSVVFFLHTKNILKRDNCLDKIYYFVYDNIAKRSRLMQISIGRLWSLCPVLSFKFTILPPNSYGLTVNFCRSFVTVSSLKWKCYEHFRKHVTNLLLMNFALIGHQYLWIELNCANFRCFEQRSAIKFLC